MDILSEMSSVYYELTTSEKRIAEYILDHTDECNNAYADIFQTDFG